MKQAWTIVAGLAASLLGAQALAADCEVDLRPEIEAALAAAPTEAALANLLTPMMAKPRYFESTCERPQLDHPLYPGVPVRQCTYEHLGLNGWVALANPGPDLAAKWIFSACADQKDVRTCLVRMTTHTWCSSQLRFPVVGNIVLPTRDASGQERGENIVFLHGVMIDRPDGMAARVPVDIAAQKKRLLELAASEHAYKGAVNQVAWPADVRQDIYVKYGLGSADLQTGDVGRSCPATARRGEWLDVSRILYNRGWRTGRNPMFAAAAKALMADETPGLIDCK